MTDRKYFPTFCSAPAWDRCCLFSHTWPMCGGAVSFAAQSDAIKGEVLKRAPRGIRRTVTITYDCEDPAQARSFDAGIEEFARDATAVRVDRVTAGDTP